MGASPFGSKTAFVAQAWRGELKLWVVYWLYGGITGIALGMILGLLGLPLLVTYLLMAPWAVWITVSIWRCAFNCSWRGWAYLARILALLGVANFVAQVVSAA